MSIWKSTLVAGIALSSLATLGVLNKAVGGHAYHGYVKPGYHQQYHHRIEKQSGYFTHPVYGHAFKHPIHGYKFKHPVHGYLPMTEKGNGMGEQTHINKMSKEATADYQ